MRVVFADGKTAWLGEIDPSRAPDTLDTKRVLQSGARSVFRFYAEDESC